MKVLSIDVGIKNLGLCLVNFEDNNIENHKIEYWNIINLAEDILNAQLKCCVTRRGMICNKFATKKIILEDKILGFCDLKTCQKELNSTYGKKKIKKNKLLTTKDISLQDLGKKVFKEIENIDCLGELDTVVIENQPVLKNPTMKSVQMLVYSYFLYIAEINKRNIHLKLFNAGRKLKIYDGPKIDISHLKDNYKKRKYLSVKYCIYFIEKYNLEFKQFFLDNKKKDDLSDCYLQALTYYYN